jgi:endonuclease
MRADYRLWLTQQKYDAGTITAQLHRAGRVEKLYGDLDQLFAADRLEGVLASLQYTVEDKRSGRPNPSKIPIEGDIRSNLASYKDAVRRYRRFRDAEPAMLSEFAEADAPQETAGLTASRTDEDLGQRIGLERDMQAALRTAISQLEEGLTIIDDGAERSVDSGFIDITARDVSGAIVVIELKTGAAGQRAVAQILSYMGDIASEEPGVTVRGILVASAFDKKAKSAARMVPALSLCSYGVRFQFSKESI